MGIEERAGAWRLLDRTLDSGWKIVAPLGWDVRNGEVIDLYNGTGGNFSVAYRVEKDGKEAFLKAIDLTDVLTSANPVTKLQNIINCYQFENSILEICEGKKLNRVVVAIDSGEIKVGPNLQDLAPYMIFELAEGDVRKEIRNVDAAVRRTWWLRAMHHTTVAVMQLHSSQITHQDLKPSNVLNFGQSSGFRVADLGRSVCEERPGPYDELLFSGDFTYAPPEILYGHINPDARIRRIGCDIYLLGSMIFFYVTGLGCTQLLIDKLHSEHRPTSLRGLWEGSFEEVLPILQNSFTEVLSDFSDDLDGDFKSELLKAASELCNPDPSLRGHPLEKRGTGHHLSVSRYVSLFDRLSKKSAIMDRLKR